MRIKRVVTLMALACGVGLAGCQVKPDIEGQKDIGFKRPERSDEVIAEQTGGGPPTDDMTTRRSASQRAAADALASGKTATGTTTQ